VVTGLLYISGVTIVIALLLTVVGLVRGWRSQPGLARA
jgi:hypothetical protein